MNLTPQEKHQLECEARIIEWLVNERKRTNAPKPEAAERVRSQKIRKEILNDADSFKWIDDPDATPAIDEEDDHA